MNLKIYSSLVKTFENRSQGFKDKFLHSEKLQMKNWNSYIGVWTGECFMHWFCQFFFVKGSINDSVIECSMIQVSNLFYKSIFS